MASTYVNDLRLNEMATGDQSGSWGTVTNTNLELIGEAFSYGTEAITTNADTHTTTIADGASDPGRAMFLKYTGTLDSACTITIGPNTVSKMWFIENATSGSQNIIISQGSGANVTIAAGETKAVYSDGAGAGAAFVDAFAALSVGALSSSGAVSGTTGTFTGAVSGTSATFNGGVDIDNINIDGTTIALSSGDLTLDVAGDIIFDADGADIKLLDNGVQFGTIFNLNNNFYIQSNISDGDIYFYGSDGGANINALILDMSAAGRANFNAGASFQDHVNFGDDDKAVFGASDDLSIYHSSSDNNSYIEEIGSGSLVIAADQLYVQNAAKSETKAIFTTDGSVALRHNDATKFTTTTSGVDISGTAVTDGVTVDGTLDIEEVFEKVSTNTTTSGTYSEAVTSSGVFYLTNNQTANRTINFTGVNSALATGQSVTVSVLATQGSTAYYFNAYQVDSSAVTPKWSGGSAPTEGNASGIDVYTFTIIKTADATFTVLASQTQFA